jgi:uncharacterized protein involved in outer membrane biogenesis
MIRKLLAAAVILFVLAGGALALFARGVIGGESVRQTLEAQLSRRLGQPVRIDSLSASFFPRVTIDLHEVAIGQPSPMTISEVSIATGLRGLFSRRVEDAEIIISNSRVPVEMALGIVGVAASGSPSSDAGGLTIVSIRALALHNVELVVGQRSLIVDLQSSINGDRLDVARLAARSAGTLLQAHGALTSITKRTGAFTATASRLNFDELLALASGVSMPVPSSSPPGSALDLSVDVTAPYGEVGDYRFQKLASIVRITPERVVVAPLKLEIFGGRYDGKLDVTLSSGSPVVALNGRAEGMDVSALLRETQGSSSMSGRLAGNFSLTTRGSSSAELIRAARGAGRTSVTDGAIPGLDMVRALVLAFGKPSGAPPPGTGSRFTRIDATFALGDQTLTSHDMAFASRDFDMTGGGSVRLPAGALEMRADVVLSRELTSQAGTDFRRYAQEDGRIVVPATITGTVEHPSVSLDITAAASRALQNEVKRKAKGLLDRIFK